MNDKQSALFPNSPNVVKRPKPSESLNVLQGLDRAEVAPLAARVFDVVFPFAHRVTIAGSFRRQRDIINDLDIVVLPHPGCWVEMLKVVRLGFDAVTERQGDKLARLYLPFASSKGQGYEGHIQVDFYRADPTTWAILLLVRTGSKEHNVKLCNLAIQKGLRLQYSVGLTDQNGHVVAGRTEEEVFQGLGLPFIEPKDREVLE